MKHIINSDSLSGYTHEFELANCNTKSLLACYRADENDVVLTVWSKIQNRGLDFYKLDEAIEQYNKID